MAVNKVIYGGNTLVDLTGDTVTAADLADGVKATGADGNPIVGIMQKVTIDAELSTTSTNPVQNKVIYNALLNKVGTDIFSGFALMGATSTISWGQGSQPIGSINAINYTGTAAMATRDAAGNTISTTYASKTDVSALLSTKLGVNSTAYAATRDGAGNNIVDTYAKKTDISGFVKSVNGTKPDTNGNVAINVSGGVSTSVTNTWTAQQNFHDLILNRERYTTYVVKGTYDTPTTSTMLYTAVGAFTLNLATLAGALSAGQSSVFTAYFAANADYPLTITNAGTIKYIGSASDVAITSAGLLLNIMMLKDVRGNLTSIVQASKLEGGA